MGLRTTLEPTWRDWVLLNLGRGCAHGSLIADMIREGHDPEFARMVVEQLARDPSAMPVYGGPPQLAASAADGSANRFSFVTTTAETIAGANSAVAESPLPPMPAATVPAGYVLEPSRVCAGNVIHTSDREIHVVMRLTKPEVIVLADLLTAEECDELVRLSAPKIQRSTAIDADTGQPTIIANRTSHGTFFHLNETDFIARLDRRIAEVMNWPLENGEGIQILNYGIGGEYRPHFDYFPPQQAGSTKPLREGGQRTATLIMYLNDVEEGGATIFPEIGLSVLPRKGQAVYFSYFNSLGQVDPLTLHGGAPVSKGEKWIATKWMRQWRRG